ncbi:MAG: outer membrane lipid asymmetry maintenance protein MlaD [Chromatiaceae bacterium]
MSRMRTIEVLVGAFMAAGFVALFFLAMKVSNLSAQTAGEGYLLMGRFDNIGSLKVRAPVTMAGVRIGRVQAIGFDKSTYEAVVTLSIGKQYDTIPTDTFANIYTAGLLGEQYVGLSPGGSQEYMHPGDTFMHTQSALILEQMIGQFLFKKAEEGSQ